MCQKIEISYDVVNDIYNTAKIKKIDKEVESLYLSELSDGKIVYLPSIAHEGVTVYKDDDGDDMLAFDSGIIKVEVFTEEKVDDYDLKNIEYEMQEEMVGFVANLAHRYSQIHRKLEDRFLD